MVGESESLSGEGCAIVLAYLLDISYNIFVVDNYFMIAIAPPSETVLTYEEALLYCTFCRYGGYRDWRMPTLSEFHAHSTIYGWTIMSHPVDSMYTWLWITPVRDI